MQSEDQVYFLINHKLTRAYVTHRHAKNLRHVSPQNRFTLKEFETTTRETGLIIFRHTNFLGCVKTQNAGTRNSGIRSNKSGTVKRGTTSLIR